MKQGLNFIEKQIFFLKPIYLQCLFLYILE